VEKSLLRRILNRLLHVCARFLPGCVTLRPFLHKLRGVSIRGHVFIGDEVYIENEYPECIEIDDGTQITLRTTIMAHFRGTGRVLIRKDVWIGPHSLIAASSPGQVLTIGEGAVLAAGCVVTEDVPAHTMMAGVPARPIALVRVPMKLNTRYEDFKNGLAPISLQ
jgi:acetyltransferase-like isoleucine patch superfamily enzyme